MINDFHTYLVQEVIDEKLKELRMQKSRQFNSKQTTQLRTIAWIEKLIQSPIADYVMRWEDKCAELRRLDPSRREFSDRVRRRIDEVMRDRIRP
jgi:hypothetical protein